MNILLQDGLPEEYDGIPISADFRNMIQVEIILRDPDLSASEKTFLALTQLYPEIPDDIEKALAGLQWFFARGKQGESSGNRQRTASKGFDFEQDASYIYAAFVEVYSIRLAYVDFLHWWEFMVLFESLPENTLIQRIIYWRTVEIGKLPKTEQKHVQKMRKLFALQSVEAPAMSIEDVDRRTKERVAKRFEEARRRVAEKQGT